MNTIEGNKLIAEFMGWKRDDDFYITPFTNFRNIRDGGYLVAENSKTAHFNNLKFHSSWDWLMPVVEKIESLGFVVHIKRNTVFMQNNHEAKNCMHGHTVTTNKKESVYSASVEFIKWYNKNKTQ